MPKTDISVGDLVSMIERGELQLPEMQRRYVWTSTRALALDLGLYVSPAQRWTMVPVMARILRRQSALVHGRRSY